MTEKQTFFSLADFSLYLLHDTFIFSSSLLILKLQRLTGSVCFLVWRAAVSAQHLVWSKLWWRDCYKLIKVFPRQRLWLVQPENSCLVFEKGICLYKIVGKKKKGNKRRNLIFSRFEVPHFDQMETLNLLIIQTSGFSHSVWEIMKRLRLLFTLFKSWSTIHFTLVIPGVTWYWRSGLWGPGRWWCCCSRLICCSEFGDIAAKSSSRCEDEELYVK